MNLAAVIEPHAARSTAIISGPQTITYGQLRAHAAGVRGGLAARDIATGDRVAVVAANNWQFVAAYLGVLGSGAVAVPLNPLSPPAERERELAMVGARLALVDAAAAGALASEQPGTATTPFEGVMTVSDLLTAEPTPLVERADDDLAVLLFTSGTAGLPRPAMLTHGNLRANIDQILGQQAGTTLTADDVALGVIPLFHVFGLNALLGLALTVGSSVLLVERFEPGTTLELIAEHGVTVVSGVPTMWQAWAGLPVNHEGQGSHPPGGGAMATVRLAVSGAAPLDPAVRRAVAARYGVDLVEGYGLTEASPAVTSGVGLDAPDGSIGVPLPGVQVRLIDRFGEDALVGDPGEIWVKGPNVFSGYWNDPDATRHTLTEDGWLRTGDLAVVDDDGFLFLVDRAKDVIIVSGFNVVPAEVEQVLVTHPDVAAAAVVGVPDPRSGEAVKAFVVPVEGSDVDEAALIAFACDNLARYKCPSTVAFVDELPHGLAGEVLRRSLR